MWKRREGPGDKFVSAVFRLNVCVIEQHEFFVSHFWQRFPKNENRERCQYK